MNTWFGVFFLIFPVTVFSSTCNENLPVCKEAMCEILASSLVKYMDLNASAVNDPHQYYCGNLNTSANDYLADAKFAQIKYYDSLRYILQADFEGPPILASAPKIYKSCHDLNQRMAIGYNTLFGFINEIGGFPLLDNNWNESNYNVEKAVALLKARHGVDTVFTLGLNFVLDLRIWNPKLFESEPNWTERQKLVESYFKMVSEEKVSSEEIQKAAIGVVSFEKDTIFRFTQGTSSAILGRTLKQLYKSDKIFNWTSVFEALGQETGVKLPMTTSVLIDPFLESNEYPKAFMSKSKRVLANYLAWRLIHRYRNFVTVYMAEIENEREKQGLSVGKFCMNMISEKLYYIREKIYLDKYVSEESRKEAGQMAEAVRSALSAYIQKHWKRDTSGIERLKGMTIRVGQTESEESLRKMYPGVEAINGSDILKDLSLIEKASLVFILKTVQNPPKLDRADLLIPHFKLVFGNVLEMPSDLFVFPMYVAEAPMAYKFGTFGVTLVTKTVYTSAGQNKNGWDEDWNVDNPTVAYEAYQLYRAKYNGQGEKRLPSPLDNLSSNQLFLLGNAHLKCTYGQGKNVVEKGTFNVYYKRSGLLKLLASC